MRIVSRHAGLALLALALVVALGMGYATRQKRLDLDKQAAAQAATLYVQALAQGDQQAVQTHSWGFYQHDNLAPGVYDSFRDAQILDVQDVRRDSAKNRPSQYDLVHRMMTVALRIRLAHPDDAGNPAGDYTLYVLVVQPVWDADWLVAETGSAP